MIGKLGWLEKIFNTPSHHRAHHGSNPIYLDKNYGGILIIFDRLFGTFVEETEEEPVTYGLVKPLDSWNPIYISVHEWILMGRNVCKSWSSPSDIFGYLFAAPGWSPDGKGLLAADKNAEDVNKRADLQRQDP